MSETQRNDNRVLVKQAARGNAKAFATLYEQIYEDLFRFALFTLRHKEDAEDAVANGCLKAFRSMAALRHPEKFRSWMFQIVANECRMIQRAKSRHAEEELGEQIEANVADPALSIDLETALRALSEEERLAITLSVFGGFNSEEIGAFLGLAAGTIRSLKSRGYEKLRETLS